MMNTKTGLWALGLFAVSSVVMINCGGDSDGGNSNTGGTSSAGNSTTAGMSSTAGKGGNGTSGSSNTAGNTNSGGNNNSAGGEGPGPGTDGGSDGGPDIPGFGGDGNVPACPAEPAGKECTREQDGQNVCLGENQVCNCRREGQNGPTTWQCLGGDTGAGGAGPGDFMVDCGDSPMTGDDCEGLGLCVGSTSCGCVQGSVYCSP